MGVLYGTSLAYGVGTGVWVDAIAGVSDPGLGFIAPILFGAAMPIGLYATDQYVPFHRGVPESVSTGLLLGAVEGVAIAGTQWQLSRPNGNSWSFAGQTTATWIFSTGGGIGGYIFGEWLRPDSRSLTFIASGGAWGAIAGSEFGAAIGPTSCSTIANPGSTNDIACVGSSASWANGAAVAGLIGYNVGLAATGALSARYMPSWRTQKYMWLGFLAGTAASSLVYLFYIGSSDDPRHGLIANSLGGLAGVGIAGALAANLKDDDTTNNAVQHGTWKQPFDISFRPVQGPIYGSTQTSGVTINAMGEF
jgi:hypothetical protein